MVDNITPTTGATAARYTYYTVDIVTNTVLAQIPFEDVKYERSLKGAGAFDGKITVSDQTDNLDLYNSTMPGKTALYVLRNDVCVWGGVIWNRTYDMVGRSLAISGMEFTSYLSRRHIWKTFTYNLSADLTKTTKTGSVKVEITSGTLKVPLSLTDSTGAPTKVNVSFVDADLIKYSGFYSLTNTEAPTLSTFYISIPKLPAYPTARSNVTVSVKVDTYDYVREIINSTLSDYYNVDFANEIATPGVNISYRSVSNNIVSVTTVDIHDLVPGQNVKIENIDTELNGTYPVAAVTGTKSFSYKIPTYTVTAVKRDNDIATITVNTDTREFIQYPVGSNVTVTVSGQPSFSGTAYITDKTNNTISFTNVGTNLANTAATGTISIADVAVNSTVLDNDNYKVYFREIKSTGPKSITYVKRVAGYVTLWTKTNHGFKKGDAVNVSIKDTANDKFDSFKYYQSTKTASSNNIQTKTGSRVKLDSAKSNKTQLATPIKKLVLSTQDTHDYKVGDNIYVTGVDGLTWKSPIYNGYKTITELDIQSASVTHVKRVSDKNYVYTSANHGFDIGDSVTIAGITSQPTFNGTYQITGVYDPENASSGTAYFTFKTYGATDLTSKTNVSANGGTAKTAGDDWIAFDMPESGTVTEPNNAVSISKVKYETTGRVVTITTTGMHGMASGDKVQVATGEKGQEVFNGTYTIKTVLADDIFTYSLNSESDNLPKEDKKLTGSSGSVTRIRSRVGYFPDIDVPFTRVKCVNEVVTIYSLDHNLNTGQKIFANFSSGTYSSFENGGVPIRITDKTANTFSYSSPGSSNVGHVTVQNRSRNAAGVVTLTTVANHNYVAGQTVTVSGVNYSSMNGEFTLLTASGSTLTYDCGTKGVVSSASAGANAKTISTLSATGTVYLLFDHYGTTEAITNIASTGSVVTVGVENHAYSVGDFVLVRPYNKTYYTRYANKNKPVKVTAVTDNTISYSLTSTSMSTTATDGAIAFAAQVEKKPTVTTRSWGEFPTNAALGGLEFSTENYSNLQYQNTTIRGSDLTNLGELLDSYTNSIKGFDYRIDCSVTLDSNNNKVFKRTFVMIPRIPQSLTDYLATLPDGKLAKGEYAPISAFGADKLVFEYPGNAGNFSMVEDASSSATRIFVVGNNDDLGSGAGSRYSAASDTELLAKGWPILDRVEKQEWPLVGINAINVDNWGNYDAEIDFNKTASRMLQETKPPMGDFRIAVNGSLHPYVGTYDPGDWCSLIINDKFFRSRLASDLEPRPDVVMRKIDKISVQVPNNPAFPELIDLDLVTEWEVDRSGQ
jgi:hypothetical protein